jgi:hypothetical protein
MNVDPRFYRVAAACSLLSSVTTLLLIFLPEWFAPAPDFAARMARVHEGAYQLRSWVYLLHPFLAFAAAMGVALALRERAPVLAIAGIAGFLLWAINEAGQQGLTLFAFDRWRLAWDEADDAMRESIRINTLLYDGIWDGMYMVLLVGFAIGNACLGSAMIAAGGLARIAGGFMLAACVLTVALFFNELNLPLLPATLLDWSYPAIQPLGRALIGVWLWRMSTAAASSQNAPDWNMPRSSR